MGGARWESEARFAAYLDSLAGVLGHADQGGSAKTKLGWSLRATRRPSRPRRAGVLQALWPKPADDRRRVAGAKACAPGRSRVWTAGALRREARPTASIAPHRIGQPQHRDAGAERPVASVSHVGQHDAPGHTILGGGLDLGERDLRLGPKLHVLGNVRRFSTLRRRSPSFPADRADRRSPGQGPGQGPGPNSRDDGDREGHRDLTIVRLAQPTAILLWVLRLSWNPVNHGRAGLRRFDDLAVAPAIASLRDIGLQQDPRLQEPLSRALSFPNQDFKLLAPSPLNRITSSLLKSPSPP